MADRLLVAQVLAQVGRPLILDGWRRDSCVVSTRIAVETFKAFGHPARAVRVGVLAANAEAVTLLQRHVAVEEWPATAWTVGIDPEAGGRHVVAVVKHNDGALLVDLAADQMDRPAHGLRVPGPIVANMPPEFLQHGTAALGNDTGTVVHYTRAKAGSLAWLDRSPDWRERRRWAPVVGQLVRGIRQHERSK